MATLSCRRKPPIDQFADPDRSKVSIYVEIFFVHQILARLDFDVHIFHLLPVRLLRRFRRALGLSASLRGIVLDPGRDGFEPDASLESPIRVRSADP